MSFRTFDEPRETLWARIADFDVAAGTYTLRGRPSRWIDGKGEQHFSVCLRSEIFVANARVCRLSTKNI